jgi:hypothetical protein
MSMQERVAEGKVRAAERFAALPAETQAQVRAMVEGIPELMTRVFCGPPNEKGRQSMYIATPAELAEYRKVAA